MRRALIATAMTLLIGGDALAQSQPVAPTPACPATPTPPPAELAGWADAQPAVAAADPVSAGKVGIAEGRAVEARLVKSAALRFAAQPEKAGASDSYGGLLTFTAKTSGTYRVALGSGAWVDVVRDGKPVTSSAHGHGPVCSGIRKMVDFPLTAGDHLIQIAGSATPAIRLLAVRLP